MISLPLSPSTGRPMCPTCGIHTPPPIVTHDGKILCSGGCFGPGYDEYKPPSTGKKLIKYRRRPKGLTIAPRHRVMVWRQDGVCAVCGVPGWGTKDGIPKKIGSLMRSKMGDQTMGIFCRPCAAAFQKFRLRMIRYCEAKRGPSGNGPGDQGGG